jgi:hypothetical protein
MPEALSICIVYNKSNTFGLAKDAELLAAQLPVAARKVGGRRVSPVKLMDSREPPVVCDIAIHLEVPYAVWFPWARSNVMLVNSEWWNQEAWGAYLDSFDIAVYRDSKSLTDAKAANQQARELLQLLWATPFRSIVRSKRSYDATKGFVYFLGGSPNKRAAAEEFLPLWQDSFPQVHVYVTEPLTVQVPSNVYIHVGYLDIKQKEEIAAGTPGHICWSKAESFGYTAAEAEQVGAFVLLNKLPCYEQTYNASEGIAWTEPTVESLTSAVEAFLAADLQKVANRRQERSAERLGALQLGLGTLLTHCCEAIETRHPVPKHMPPLLNPIDCPPISVITLVHNRPQFIKNACLNLLSSDYPREKMEWVIVDDSDPDKSPSDMIVQFEQQFAPGRVVYIPLTRQRSIGYKRNLGVEKATANILLMMDDDDHYPSTSFRRRVAYLLKGRRTYECATCTMIAMYDLMKGQSAVNVPPYGLSLTERCSEATLTFTRNFWKARPFPDVSVAEGEEFLKGRCSQVVEMPPQQIIVAMNHNSNSSSRRGLPNAGNGCFWGFERPLLEFLHGLVGIKVEAA